MTIEDLKKQYEAIVTEYVEKFCKKQDLTFKFWICNEIGSIACFEDIYFYDFKDILFDINTKRHKGLIVEWVEYCLEWEGQIDYSLYAKGKRIPDLPSLATQSTVL